ncbi:hypothetical protein D1818_06440 [Aquimarina sp. BL5]|uniref:hypothetical protein n=1 Tax=Aquimarina sp. BL5 TaxID=1714860 RepID=UPI000E47FF6D|nr:hypothetical protein [Aquimarina sp. BL5]AXT50485.1 hypothetical protein D1818_06440 [Aquimarina sp. BL5]RKM87640.1 hypothetical protein D7036_25025 [Aquimarina sp. BL5]
MLNSKKIVAILPVYNAEKILPKNCNEIPFDIIDGSIFDNKMLAQLFFQNLLLEDVLYLTKYLKEVFSINFKKNVIYGFDLSRVSITYFSLQNRIIKSNLLK